MPDAATIHDLKPYPAYRDSGVPWLGKIPAQWEVLPALAAYKPKLVKNTGMVEKTVLSLSYGRIIVKPEEKLRGLVPESFETYQIVEPGNIIVRTTDLQNDQTSLRVGYSRFRGIITAAYMCLETKGCVLSKFGYQFLNAYDLLKIIYGFGSGLRQNLDFSHIKRMPVLVPPKTDQSAIVYFLDHVDRAIGRYIRAKKKLIALLNEQKQVIIQRAVTRGLNPNVRLKPSGVQWLGDVPEHWEVRKVRDVANVVNGYPFDAGRFSTIVGHPLIRIRDLDKTVTAALYDGPFVEAARIEPGELLIGMDGDFNVGTWAGSVPALLNQRMCCVRGHSTVINRLLRYMLPGPLKAINDVTWSTTVKHLASSQVERIGFACPPEREQMVILQHLDSAIPGLNRVIDTAQRKTDLLREFRTRLIADVATGKLDVREIAAQLPYESEEPELPDDVEALAEGEEEVESADVDAATEEVEA